MKRLLYPVLTSIILSIGLSSTAQKKVYPNTLLWRITGNGLTKPSYLFGTMHLNDRRLFHFSDSLYNYLEKAEAFAMEVDADEMMRALIISFSAEDTSGYLEGDFTPASACIVSANTQAVCSFIKERSSNEP
jgi:uncharacterized protein YbaP (TraB family)